MTPEPADDRARRDDGSTGDRSHARQALPPDDGEGRRHGHGGEHDGPGGGSGDPLVAARIALEDVGELPLERRAAVFERVHSTVVEELRQLELG